MTHADAAVRAALDELAAEREAAPDVVQVAHLAIDAALEAARIRGARAAVAARMRPGTVVAARAQGDAEKAARAAGRAAGAAHDAVDMLVVAFGARS